VHRLIFVLDLSLAPRDRDGMFQKVPFQTGHNNLSVAETLFFLKGLVLSTSLVNVDTFETAEYSL
jgi:hypothetical protein